MMNKMFIQYRYMNIIEGESMCMFGIDSELTYGEVMDSRKKRIIEDYRLEILSMIPHIVILDDEIDEDGVLTEQFFNNSSSLTNKKTMNILLNRTKEIKQKLKDLN